MKSEHDNGQGVPVRRSILKEGASGIFAEAVILYKHIWSSLGLAVETSI